MDVSPEMDVSTTSNIPENSLLDSTSYTPEHPDSFYSSAEETVHKSVISKTSWIAIILIVGFVIIVIILILALSGSKDQCSNGTIDHCEDGICATSCHNAQTYSCDTPRGCYCPVDGQTICCPNNPLDYCRPADECAACRNGTELDCNSTSPQCDRCKKPAESISTSNDGTLFCANCPAYDTFKVGDLTISTPLPIINTDPTSSGTCECTHPYIPLSTTGCDLELCGPQLGPYEDWVCDSTGRPTGTVCKDESKRCDIGEWKNVSEECSRTDTPVSYIGTTLSQCRSYCENSSSCKSITFDAGSCELYDTLCSTQDEVEPDWSSTSPITANIVSTEGKGPCCLGECNSIGLCCGAEGSANGICCPAGFTPIDDRCEISCGPVVCDSTKDQKCIEWEMEPEIAEQIVDEGKGDYITGDEDPISEVNKVYLIKPGGEGKVTGYVCAAKSDCVWQQTSSAPVGQSNNLWWPIDVKLDNLDSTTQQEFLTKYAKRGESLVNLNSDVLANNESGDGPVKYPTPGGMGYYCLEPGQIRREFSRMNEDTGDASCDVVDCSLRAAANSNYVYWNSDQKKCYSLYTGAPSSAFIQYTCNEEDTIAGTMCNSCIGQNAGDTINCNDDCAACTEIGWNSDENSLGIANCTGTSDLPILGPTTGYGEYGIETQFNWLESTVGTRSGTYLQEYNLLRSKCVTDSSGKTCEKCYVEDTICKYSGGNCDNLCFDTQEILVFCDSSFTLPDAGIVETQTNNTEWEQTINIITEKDLVSRVDFHYPLAGNTYDIISVSTSTSINDKASLWKINPVEKCPRWGINTYYTVVLYDSSNLELGRETFNSELKSNPSKIYFGSTFLIYVYDNKYLQLDGNKVYWNKKNAPPREEQLCLFKIGSVEQTFGTANFNYQPDEVGTNYFELGYSASEVITNSTGHHNSSLDALISETPNHFFIYKSIMNNDKKAFQRQNNYGTKIFGNAPFQLDVKQTIEREFDNNQYLYLPQHFTATLTSHVAKYANDKDQRAESTFTLASPFGKLSRPIGQS